MKTRLKKFFLLFTLFIVVSFGIFIIWNWDKFYKAEKVVIHQVDCSKQAELLQEVLKSDQRVRSQKLPLKERLDIDHNNLEMVISIIEHCGMPTLDEVSNDQLSAIWLSLHHSPRTEFTIKYFPLIEQAVERGDLSKQQYALTKDRLLMEEGEPQLYGTQIYKGKLYKLKDPERVNARRKEMGMRPIEDYLKRFDIAFDVEQEL